MDETFTTFGKFGKDTTAAQHFLLAAITRAAPAGAFGFPLDVKLTANGVELPFSDTLENIYDRIHKQADERIAAINVAVEEKHGVVTFEKLRGMTLQEIADMLEYGS